MTLMKKLIALALLLPLQMGAQKFEKACDVFSRINTVLQTRHIMPKPIDDSLSVYVFNTVTEALDENHILFLQEDYNRLAVHRNHIDDYLKKGDCSFFDDYIEIYRSALERNKSIIEALIAEGVPYNTQDTIFYSLTAFPYNTDSNKTQKFIRKKMAYDILEDVAKQGTNKDSLPAKLPPLAEAARARVKESYLCRIDALLNPPGGFEENMYNRFYSAFCAYFDPHSTYFNYNEKASFVSAIASENYSLGLYVSQNDKEEIIVEEVVPGGPAYKTSKIDKGDQLLKLAANDMEYSVSCASMDAINDIVFSDNYRSVELTLRKKDGTVYSVALEKKVMKSESHSVYSYMLGGGRNPVGYIKIPSFYSAFDETGMKGCAEDVAKEVLKLKENNISGLIIDLQFNGGGSMDEVIAIAGMFINTGAVAVINDRDGYINTIKDYNRGMLYSGPMVVLVNGLSASSSEFFAGVMQDYGRAVIAGSSTLGKASMQTILPLYDTPDNQDFIKVTINKFYRVTGKSAQYDGVKPDVEIPALFDGLMPRESTLDTALKNDSLEVNTKFRKINSPAMQHAISLANERTANNKDFAMITDINAKVDAMYNAERPPLAVTFDSVYDDVHKTDMLWGEITLINEGEHDLRVSSPQSTINEIGDIDFYKSLDEHKIKSIKTDPLIPEAVNIIRDLNGSKLR